MDEGQSAMDSMDSAAMMRNMQGALAQLTVKDLDTSAMMRNAQAALAQLTVKDLDTSAMMRNAQAALAQLTVKDLDTSAMMRNAQAALAQLTVKDLDTSAMMRNLQRALTSHQLTLKNLNTAAFRETVLRPALKDVRLDDLLQAVKAASPASLLAEEVDEIFDGIPGSGLLLDDVAQELRLMIPFGHDLAVRRALQIVITLVVGAAVAGLAFSGGIIAAVATATGTPTTKKTWKAVGSAYDRIYGVGQYHPEKALEPKKPLTGPSDDHLSDW
jgi:hypothetical protein